MPFYTHLCTASVVQCRLFCSTGRMEHMSSCGQIGGLENKDRPSILAKLECFLFDICSEIFFLQVLTGSLPLLFFALPACLPKSSPSCKASSNVFLLWSLSRFPHLMWTFHPLKPQRIQGILTHLAVCVILYYNYYQRRDSWGQHLDLMS